MRISAFFSTAKPSLRCFSHPADDFFVQESVQQRLFGSLGRQEAEPVPALLGINLRRSREWRCFVRVYPGAAFGCTTKRCCKYSNSRVTGEACPKSSHHCLAWWMICPARYMISCNTVRMRRRLAGCRIGAKSPSKPS